eukprot:925504-Pelagomonas_calceolata.AAC.2
MALSIPNAMQILASHLEVCKMAVMLKTLGPEMESVMSKASVLYWSQEGQETVGLLTYLFYLLTFFAGWLIFTHIYRSQELERKTFSPQYRGRQCYALVIARGKKVIHSHMPSTHFTLASYSSISASAEEKVQQHKTGRFRVEA